MSARNDMRTSAKDWREHCMSGSAVSTPVARQTWYGVALACAIGLALALAILYWAEHQ